jgi:hypothetical protein
LLGLGAQLDDEVGPNKSGFATEETYAFGATAGSGRKWPSSVTRARGISSW